MNLFLFLPDAYSVDKSRDSRFREGACDAFDRRVFFVKKRPRIGGKFERIAEYKILIVEKNFVLFQIADRHGGNNSYLIYPCTPVAVEQDAAEAEIAYVALDHRVSSFCCALNFETVSALDYFARHGVGESGFDAVPKAFGLKLKRRYGDLFNMARQARAGNRLVAFGKARNEKKCDSGDDQL